MKKIISLLVVSGLLAGAHMTFAAEEQNVDSQMNEPESVAMEMVQQDGATVLPGMSNKTGALILTSATIIAMTALMFSIDDGSTTSGHHTLASHH